jgi:hypothetical protein
LGKLAQLRDHCPPVSFGEPWEFPNDVGYAHDGSLIIRARFVRIEVPLARISNSLLSLCEVATLVLGGANETPGAVAGGRIYATTVNGNIDSLGLAQ